MNRAKQLRLDAGAGIHETALKAGIGKLTLHKIEAGKPVQAASLARLSTLYGIKASELLAPAHFAAPDLDAA